MFLKLIIFSLIINSILCFDQESDIRINDINIKKSINIEIDRNNFYNVKKLRNLNYEIHNTTDNDLSTEDLETNYYLNLTNENLRILDSDQNNDLIIYNDTNSVSIRSNIGSKSSENFIRNILSLKSDKIYIHIYTNGGSVFDGLRIIEVINGLKSLNIKIICVAHKAISMGFIIYQYCDERYSLETSMLMHHDIQIGGFGGSYEEINSYLKFLNKIKFDIKSKIMNTLKWNDTEYNNIIKSEWWLYGDDIIKIGLSNKIVNIYCNYTKKYEHDIFDEISGEQIFRIYDKCPLIVSPVDN